LFTKLLAVSAVLAVVSVFLVACGGDDDDGGGGSSGGGGGGTEVEMVDFGYEPRTLSARAGQAVSLTVVNEGDQPHTFTIAGLVDSGRVEAGQSKSVSFTPTQAGTLTFFCTIHGQASMSGTVTVN
jgi:plastocyanin